ncbi:PQQ-binding-like beta-propeller repeat protein [Sunxiuqinia indica]|uniref:PQQ-binding-like beta-propeller repeat protein n=1 Tax=Sunxiuqinia indica TaxID=2692584 RepID=UPI00135A0833|nr:PQQ-binding-like beta-propeller repeat protein [Sunxiuqinia indica]
MKKIVFLIISISLLACNPKPKVTQWRGINRSGTYLETNLLKSWPELGPTEIWGTETIGNGYSSPIITDKFVYITGEIDSLGYLFKLDHQGKEIWRSAYGKEWTKNFAGSRGTPSILNDQIYVCSGSGDLCCIETENGSVLWKRNMLDDFGGEIPRFGYSQSLVINGDLVYCQPGGTDHNLIALDRNSGELVWSHPYFKERPGYNSPLLFEWNNKKILATFSAYHLLGIDAETGKLLWSQEQTNTILEEREPGKGDTHGNTILFDNGFIYYSAADGNGGVKLAISEDGNSIEEIWQTPGFDNYMGGFIKLDDQLYTGSHSKRQLVAINGETAEKTDSLKLGRGITILADGLIYFYADKGELSLVDPFDKLELISSFDIKKGTKEHFAHPVIHHGVLYIRHGNYLGAYDIRKKS